MARRPSAVRRLALSALALALFAGPAAASGCAAGFATISQVDSLRVLAVRADKPYANPGDQVTFRMTQHDGSSSGRDVQIVWIGGCFNPPGDAYYGCYSQLASVFSGGDLGALLATGLVGLGDTYSLTLPEDLVTSRPKPAGGTPYYGIAYVFFMACAGQIQPIPPEGSSAAGSFPIGCFDKQGNRLGADSFVPGYTQIYAFADGRENRNPELLGLTLEGQPLLDGQQVERCSVTEEDRLGPAGCGRPDPFTECTTYDIDIELPDDVEKIAETDPDARQPDGSYLREAVWVDYFTDRGSVDADIKLVSDAVEGLGDSHGVKWIGPSTPGKARIWAVIHDARGGQSVVTRELVVK